MKLLITGDLAITKQYPQKNIDQKVIDLFQSSDYNIVNLEAPVTESNSKIIKTGPHLKANKESTSEVLKTLSVNLCTLANNHVLDYDEEGVLDTLQFCEQNKIATVGAGKNKEEASKTFYIDSAEGKIAIINIAENEWASATESNAGANGMDLIDDVNQIKEAKATHDKVICIIHGGHLHYELPSPQVQKRYRFYADNGADAIIAHHTHRTGGFELYDNCPILYGLGSFLFTRDKSNNDEWYYGLITRLNIEKHKPINFEIFPSKTTKNSFHIHLLEGDDKVVMFDKIQHINNIINDSKLIQENWNRQLNTNPKYLLNLLSPINDIPSKYLKAALNKLGLSKLFLNQSFKRNLLNLTRCEAHAESLKAFLEQDIKKK